jgi:cytochrome c biogenesis protein CcmG/thiol:disulfide interchange protein DsbE
MKRAALWPLLVLGALLALLALGLRQQPQATPLALAGQPLPQFAAPRLDAPHTEFAVQELRGQAFVLNVWASWCAGCRIEHDALLALAAEGAPLYGLNYKDEPARAAAYLKRAGDPFRINLVDASGRIGIELGLYGVPETFVVDREGRVRLRHAGPLTPEVVVGQLRPLLAELRR